MKKTLNDLPKVWVVTGVPDFTTDPVVIAVCPDLDSAIKAQTYYSENYSDIEYKGFSQETFEETPMIYEGNFSVELRPFGAEPETYIFGKVNLWSKRKCIPEEEDPEQYDNFSFSIDKTITDTNKVTTKIRGSFESPTRVPPCSEEDLSIERVRREWLMKKINAKGLIKIVMPDFEI